MAVLAGADGPTAIARWAALKEEFLSGHLDLPNGIPRKDVFRRVLMALKPDAFQACFANWLQSLRASAAAATGVERPVCRSTARRRGGAMTARTGLGALHSVSVWASEFGLSLGQVACAEKSNEITAIPELLRLVDIKGAIITIDAMGTQKAIAEQIIEGEADYVLALKGNQETLHQAVIDHIHEQWEDDFARVDARRHQTRETGHGRQETRTYIQMPAPEGLPGLEPWKGLKSIGVVVSECVRDGKETVEVRYYISSLGVGVKRFAQAVRSHWSIENSCHWSLDVTYREDESRIREEAPARELRVAQSLHAVAAEATSRPRQRRHETPQLRLERRLPAGSPYRSNILVGAGPAVGPPLVVVAPDGALGWQVAGEVSPLASGTEDVEDGVEDVAHVGFAGPPAAWLGREVRLDQDPLGIGDIAGIVVRSHTNSTMLSPNCSPSVTVSEALDVSEETVSRWLARARQGEPEALHAHRSPGPPSKLSPVQLRLIPEFLWHGPEAYGFRGEVWTCARVAKVIEEEFGITYHEHHVARLLKRLHWTPQAPIRRALQRDEQAIARWRGEVWPELRDRA